MKHAIASTQLSGLVQQFGSPLNLIAVEPMRRNIAELNAAANEFELDFQLFFARKANKCLSFVDAARAAGAGIDVASENELIDTLDCGVHPNKMICTAAIKSDRLIERCLRDNITLTIDNQDELAAICALAASIGKRASTAIRLTGFEHDGAKLRSRFGVDIDSLLGFTHPIDPRMISIDGLHFHLDGTCDRQRVSAITQSVAIIPHLRSQGHSIRFLDIGGGIPMSYLDSSNQWEIFCCEQQRALLGQRKPITFQNQSLGLTYDTYRPLTRANWLREILTARSDSSTVARQLKDHNLQLRCEPGRSILDGCGISIARVEFCKPYVDNDHLIGLAMNNTQCRTTSNDFLVDPILRRNPSSTSAITPITGYFVGAYCTESDFISRRRFNFANGIGRGDLVAIPNTAGYLMHFMESRSHQFPLAKNLVIDSLTGVATLDAIEG